MVVDIPGADDLWHHRAMVVREREPLDYALHMAGLSLTGFERNNNEDAVGCFDDRLAVVVDSMGGNASGAFVPPVILPALREALRDARPPDDTPVTALMAAAFARAHEGYRATATAVGQAMLGAGAVVGALWLSGRRGAFAHVGDTRCYRWRDGELTQIGREHSLVQELLSNPEFQTDEGRATIANYRNVVTRAFFAERAPEPELIELDLRLGDRFLLCSDGLWRTLEEPEIKAVMDGGAPLDATLRALMGHGLAAPSGDNLSAVLAEVCESAPDRATPDASQRESLDDDALAVDALRARRWSPEHRGDDAVRACLEGHTQIEEAWEALASRGIIPMRWTDAPTRRFLCGERMEKMPLREAEGFAHELITRGAVVSAVTKALTDVTVRWRDVSALPSTLEQVARVASDVEGIERAERLIDEAASRLRPFGYASPERHLWTFADAKTRRDARWPLDLHQDALAALCDLKEIGRDQWPGDLPKLPDGTFDVVKRLCDGDDAWRAKTPFGVPRWHASLRGHPYADLPSPFRPLREIVALGYFVGEVGLWGRVLMVALDEAPEESPPTVARRAESPAAPPRPWWKIW